MSEIRVNSDAEIRREAISEDQYCVVVDEFLQRPDELPTVQVISRGSPVAIPVPCTAWTRV